jgi:tRNA threonylcarbamoyladenosine biosynthesis protein TsaB
MKNKLIISFDTTTKTTVVSIGKTDGSFTDEVVLSGKSHGPLLLPAIHDLFERNNFKKEDLVAVACGIGPGTFTGIRIGMSTAKTLAYGLNIPMIALTGFEILNHQATHKNPQNQNKTVIVAIDARRSECYYAFYNQNKITKGPGLVNPQELSQLTQADEDYIILGSGVDNYNEIFQSDFSSVQLISETQFSPNSLFAVALEKFKNNSFVKMETIEPLYIRASDAEINLRKKLKSLENIN